MSTNYVERVVVTASTTRLARKVRRAIIESNQPMWTLGATRRTDGWPLYDIRFDGKRTIRFLAETSIGGGQPRENLWGYLIRPILAVDPKAKVEADYYREESPEMSFRANTGHADTPVPAEVV